MIWKVTPSLGDSAIKMEEGRRARPRQPEQKRPRSKQTNEKSSNDPLSGRVVRISVYF